MLKTEMINRSMERLHDITTVVGMIEEKIEEVVEVTPGTAKTEATTWRPC